MSRQLADPSTDGHKGGEIGLPARQLPGASRGGSRIIKRQLPMSPNTHYPRSEFVYENVRKKYEAKSKTDTKN